LVFFLRPDVPGRWSRNGFVGRFVGVEGREREKEEVKRRRRRMIVKGVKRRVEEEVVDVERLVIVLLEDYFDEDSVLLSIELWRGVGDFP